MQPRALRALLLGPSPVLFPSCHPPALLLSTGMVLGASHGFEPHALGIAVGDAGGERPVCKPKTLGAAMARVVRQAGCPVPEAP